MLTIIRRIIGGLILLTMMMVFVALITSDEALTRLDLTLLVIISGLGAYLLFKPVYLTEEKQAKRQALLKAKQEAAEREARTVRGAHTGGLPVAEGTSGLVYFTDRTLSFQFGNSIFDVALEKVLEININTETQIQKSYVSDVGAAMAHYDEHNRRAAQRAGRPQEMTSHVHTYYMVVTYRDNQGQRVHVYVKLQDGSVSRTRNVIEKYAGQVNSVVRREEL